MRPQSESPDLKHGFDCISLIISANWLLKTAENQYKAITIGLLIVLDGSCAFLLTYKIIKWNRVWKKCLSNK